MTLDLLQEIFLEDERPDKPALRAVIQGCSMIIGSGVLSWLKSPAAIESMSERNWLPGFPDYGRNGRCVIPGLCWKHWL